MDTPFFIHKWLDRLFKRNIQVRFEKKIFNYLQTYQGVNEIKLSN